MIGVTYVISTIVVLIAIRKYKESKWGKCKNKVQLEGKVAIVTGANSGIGYEITKELARRKARVIMACRDSTATALAVGKLKSELIPPTLLIPMELDLGCVKSIENFVHEVSSTFRQVDILINNAGVSYPNTQRRTTSDGFEIHFGVNYLGHYLLTNLLLDKSMLGKASRVIVVSSLLHEKGQIRLEDLNLQKQYKQQPNPYADSKLACVYFAKELARRSTGKGVGVYAICPGWVYTNLFRHHPRKWFQYILITPVAFLFMRSARQVR